MKTSTLPSPLPISNQNYHLIYNETDEIILDFRAPPPSPTGSSRRCSSVTNDNIISNFLETTLKVPDLKLPNNIIFPRQNPLDDIPILDFRRISDSSIKECFEEFGCVQVINHVVSIDLIKAVGKRGLKVFKLGPEKKKKAVRSPENLFGFEEVGGCDEGMCEEFVWGKNLSFKVKMEGLLPFKYSKFSTKMETLAKAIEKMGNEIMFIMMNNNEDEEGSLINKHEENICHIYKHKHDLSNDECIKSLRYDVIRMMIRGCDYSHALAFHICDASSQFHVYSKKGWTSFVPIENALIITCGDQLQKWSGGRYKNVIARPIYANKNEDCISMSFLFSIPTHTNNEGEQNARIISLQDQVLFTIFLIIACQILLYVYNTLRYYCY